jgi:hypothetical protein
MSCRCYICIVWRGIVYVCYHHYDGYPCSVGSGLLEQLKAMIDTMTWDEIQAALDGITWHVNNDEHDERPTFMDNWKLLDAIKAGRIVLEAKLSNIALLNPLAMQWDLEYCYVVNFDERTLTGMMLSCSVPFWCGIPMTADIDEEKWSDIAVTFRDAYYEDD